MTFLIRSFFRDGDQEGTKKTSKCFISIFFSNLIYSNTYLRIDILDQVKDSDIMYIKSYVFSKWTQIFDAIMASGTFDFLLALIKRLDIPVGKYAYHEGENITVEYIY